MSTDFDKWLNKRATSIKKSVGMHCFYLKRDLDHKFASLHHSVNYRWALARHEIFERSSQEPLRENRALKG